MVLSVVMTRGYPTNERVTGSGQSSCKRGDYAIATKVRALLDVKGTPVDIQE